jgi:hypothetical protein
MELPKSYLRATFSMVAVATICTLLVMLVILSRQNSRYQQDNRQLIILNDSITAANIALTNSINFKDSTKVKIVRTTKPMNQP